MAAIEVEGLEKTYAKGVRALDGLTFSVDEGEVFGLLGPNGAGKSTTVKILVTLSTADAGRAIVAGHDVMRDPQAVRRAIGYVPQNSGVDVHATGRENLFLQGRVQRVAPADLRHRVDELLDVFGIRSFADRIVRTYSGGMKRRLDVAMGLVHRPTVLFLDEPTTGLDPEARAAMWEELARLASQEQLTILLTTHYLEEADSLARRIAIVSRGKVAVCGQPDELKQELLGDSVAVELADGGGTAATDVLGRLGAVEEVLLDGRMLRARVRDGARAVPVILSALETEGIAVRSATVSRPSLDDVYLHYTGRDFRSEDAEGTGVA